jgi:hypothetical protein
LLTFLNGLPGPVLTRTDVVQRWTQVKGSVDLYCRRNGRAFRIARGKDKRWKLYRIASLEDAGELLGTYQGRREANKALERIAYQPEPRW